jgi:hypothetical protein
MPTTMTASFRVYLSIGALLAVLGLQAVRAQQVSQLIWQLGIEDQGQGEFTQEQSSNDPPGDPAAQDDDFYFAGTYPDPIGVVSQTEPWKNYDRALTPGDPRNRIHFNLDKNTANATNDLKVTVSMVQLGAVDGTPGTHDLVMRFNGHDFYSTNGLAENLRVEETLKASAVEAVVGENIIEIERTGGSDGSWVQFDFVRLEIPASDTDGDGMPDSYEKQYPAFLSPTNAADAAKDQDADGLTNLEEYTAKTDPTKADTDGDGLSDTDEVKTTLTDPLSNDSDRDGLKDGEEINQYKTNPNNPDSDGDGLTDSYEVNTSKTDPTLADTDGDGTSDSLELKLGSDPKDPASLAVAFTQIWLLGLIDNNQAEFSQEVGGSPEAPGDATLLDDDYYFAGTYPDPIGLVPADEDLKNFERALTSGNTFSRLHFNLSAAQVKTNSQYLITFQLFGLGSGGGPSLHDISFRFNGNEFHKETQLGSPKKVEEIVNAPDVKAVAGENIIELERTDGTASSWIQFDYIEMDYRELTPQTAKPKMSVSRTGSNLTIQWSPTGGTLESTPALSGKPTWTTVGGTNPATVPIGTGNLFYRVKQ